jgi:hypothetical protein
VPADKSLCGEYFVGYFIADPAGIVMPERVVPFILKFFCRGEHPGFHQKQYRNARGHIHSGAAVLPESFEKRWFGHRGFELLRLAGVSQGVFEYGDGFIVGTRKQVEAMRLGLEKLKSNTETRCQEQTAAASRTGSDVPLYPVGIRAKLFAHRFEQPALYIFAFSVFLLRFHIWSSLLFIQAASSRIALHRYTLAVAGVISRILPTCL